MTSIRHYIDIVEGAALELPSIEVGDTVMVGKWKNRKATIKGFTADQHNQPVLKTNKGDQKLFKPRLTKLMTESDSEADRDAEWEAILAHGARVKREARAYAKAGKPAKFLDRRHNVTYLVSKDLNYPPDGWRVTIFGRDGQPTGHWEAKNAYEAFREVLAGEKERIGPNHIDVDKIDEAKAPMDSLAALAAWGESIGVLADVVQRPDGIELYQIDRDKAAPKGRGADFIRALCAYADAHQTPLYLTVLGWNDHLADYYRQFGFAEDETDRDEETGDVLMVRPVPGIAKP